MLDRPQFQFYFCQNDPLILKTALSESEQCNNSNTSGLKNHITEKSHSNIRYYIYGGTKVHSFHPVPSFFID